MHRYQQNPAHRIVLTILGACWTLTALTVFAQSESASMESALEQISDDFERYQRQADPLRAGQEGDREALRELPDVSRDAELARRLVLISLRDRLARVESTRLPPAAALNHSLLSYLVRQRIEEIDLDVNRIAFRSRDGFHTLPLYVARGTRITSREDAEAWLARLAAMPAYYEQNIENLRRGVRTRYTQPRIIVEGVLDTARKQAAVSPADSPLLLPLVRLPSSMPPEVQSDFRNRALGLVRDRIQPAQRRFADFLAQDYAPAARQEFAWRSMPDGVAVYRFLVRRETTTDMSPDQVHQLGVAEVNRIRQLMQAAIAESGFAGSFAGFLHTLRTDPRFYASTPQQLIDRVSEIAKRVDGELPRLFGTLPRLPFSIQPFPAEVAEGAATGQYTAGSIQLGRAGSYMINTSHLDQRPLYELPALTLHEAAPGHHVQIALSQELRDLPYFRRNMGITAFVEGWGLYAESLGVEMGIYRDPYERFGRYSYEMWRACRLVADTGIHWLGWSIEQARRCFAENSALTPHNIETELERYVSWPAQALSYKVGEQKLRELRQVAQQALGERFDVRAFHDQVLLAGALPLNVLEARIREWVRSQSPTVAAP